MSKHAFHVLRIGVGITVLWIGIMIVQEPLSWAGYMDPWVINLIPFPLETMMLMAGIFDILLGVLLLVNVMTKAVGYIVALHMLGILIAGGINDITVRDIAILFAGLALGMDAQFHKELVWWR